ncbi:hypothetical protein ACXXDK_08460 [Deinococcus sp. PESE-38]
MGRPPVHEWRRLAPEVTFHAPPTLPPHSAAMNTLRPLLLAATLLTSTAGAGAIGTSRQPHDPAIRSLIGQAIAQEKVCQSAHPSKNTQSMCDKRDATLRRIRAKGWCWGSTNPNEANAGLYWLPCSRNKVH